MPVYFKSVITGSGYLKDIDISFEKVTDDKHLNVIDYCKKYVFIFPKDIWIFCFSRKEFYRKVNKNQKAVSKLLIPDSPGFPWSHFMKLEENISYKLADSIIKHIPKSLYPQYICFGDTHGDVCLLNTGLLLNKHYKGALTIDLGDDCKYHGIIDEKINNRWNYPTTIEENAFRTEFTWKLSQMKRKNFETIWGNHDKCFGRDTVAIVAINKNRQIIFAHAIIPRQFIINVSPGEFATDKNFIHEFQENAEKIIFRTETVKSHMGDKLYYFEKTNRVKFIRHYHTKFREDRAPPMKKEIVEKEMRKYVKLEEDYVDNLFMICGHDHYYSHVASVIDHAEEFPFPFVNPKCGFIGDITNIKGNSLFYRIITVDGLF